MPGAANHLIDFSTKHGHAIWSKATKPLWSNESFDCTPEGLRDFLSCLRARGNEQGWTKTIFSIQEDLDSSASIKKDLLANYGSFTLKHLTEVVATYSKSTTDRRSQDSKMLYHCLFNSLSSTGRNKLERHMEDYKIDGEEEGVLYLKVIIRASAIDTNATETSLRTQVGNLDKYIATVDYDIPKFNQHVHHLVSSLASRGAPAPELLTNLFKAYAIVKDTTFQQYMASREDKWEDGESDITPEKLMLLAENKYKTLVEKGTWKAKSKEAQEIVALRAEIKAKWNKQSTGNKDKGKNKAKNDKKGNKKDKKTTRERKNEPWMTIAPKSGEPHTKTKDSEEWFWCKQHKKWGKHKTEACEGIGVPKHKPDSDKLKTKHNKSNPKLVRAQKATVRFQQEESDESSSSEGSDE